VGAEDDDQNMGVRTVSARKPAVRVRCWASGRQLLALPPLVLKPAYAGDQIRPRRRHPATCRRLNEIRLGQPSVVHTRIPLSDSRDVANGKGHGQDAD
jgi:hypothetical protein